MAITDRIKRTASSIAKKMAKDTIKKAAKVALKVISKAIISLVAAHLPIVLIAVIIVLIISLISIPTINNVSAALLPADDNYIVKIDEEGAAPAVSLSQLEEGINEWLKSHKGMRENALEVAAPLISAQSEYKVNAVFMLAIARVECGIGTNSKHGYNWWSFGIHTGLNFNSAEDCVNTAADGIANGSYYFTQGRYTVNEIGEVYCPDSDVPGQSQPWQENVRNYMTELYNAMGITVTSSSGASQGDILGKAQEILEYIRANGFTYGAPGRSIPDIKNGKKIDCSSYVSWVLYESGYTEFKGHQHTSSDFCNNTMNWQVIDREEDLQPGDILAYEGHVEIYAGNGKIYNAGSTKAIRETKQPYNKTRSFYTAVRPPAIVNTSSSGVATSGDGYTQVYSANGRTYKEYKQSRGSYKDVKYSSGTVSSSGCGPTSAAIVASGYGSNYNPGTLIQAAKSKYGVSNFTASPDATGKMLKTAGLSYKQTTGVSKQELQKHLRTGKPAVVSVNNSCGAMFTGATHYIAILAINGNQVYVSNPNPKKATGWVDISNVITCNSGRAAFLITE